MSQDPSFPTPPAPPPPPAPPGAPPPGYGGGAEGPRFPWEERDRLGFLEALVETVKLLVTAPKDAFSRLRADGDLVWPLVFGLILSWIAQVFSQIWSLIFGSAIQSMMGGLGDMEGFAAFGATSLLQTVFVLVLWPLFFGIGIFIAAGISHLCLMLVGAVTDSPTGFEGTLKVVAYSQVASLAAVVPILGGLIAFVGTIVLYVIGFTEVHRTTTGKAVAAVLIPIALCCVCAIIMAFVFGASMAAMMGAAAANG